MAYTWQEVMLGVDVKRESTRKQEEYEEMQQKAKDEAKWTGWLGTGLSILGYAVAGPLGGFVGKQLATYGVDAHYDWEEYGEGGSKELDQGKFNRKDIRDLTKSIKEEAADQTWGQALNTVLDLGKMYVQAGGLTAEGGKPDLTTFGSGGVEGGEWSVRGKGAPTISTWVEGEGAGDISMYKDIANPDFVPSIWQSDATFWQNLQDVGTQGSKVIMQDQAADSGTDALSRIAGEWFRIQQAKSAGERV